MATSGLVCGIVSIVLCWVPFVHFVLCVLAIVFGGITAAKYRYGKAAVVIGIISLVLMWVLLIAIFFGSGVVSGVHQGLANAALSSQQ